jgi:hypothetical protein
MKKQIQIILVLLSVLLFGKETFSQVYSSAEYNPSYLGNGRFYISKAVKVGSDVFTARNESYTATATTKHVASIVKNDRAIVYKLEYTSTSSALEFRDFIVDAGGNFYVVGYTPEPAIFKQGNSAMTGSFLLKISPEGYVTWAKSITGNVRSVVSLDDLKLLLLTDVNGPVMYSIDKSNGANLALEYQMAEGTAKAGKLYSDGTRFYFTLTFNTSSIRVSPTVSAITNSGGYDAALVRYNATTKQVNWVEKVASSADDQINDLEFTASEIYFVGSKGNQGFLMRETSSPAQGGRFYTNFVTNNSIAKAVAYNVNENKVYALYESIGTVFFAAQQVVNRNNYSDLVVASYVPTSPTTSTGVVSYSAYSRLYASERMIGGDLLVTGTNEVQVFGSADGELFAQDNIGTHQLYNPATIYNTFRATLNTGACPSVASPSAISGPSNYCQGVSTAYSISAVDGASSYTWTLPNGWTGSSTSPSISIVPNSASGTISVKANNACGNSSAVVTKVLTAGGAPAVPTLITGPSNLCPGISATYSIDSVSGASSYVWTVPSGWTGVSTTKSITVTAGANSGNISVSAKNSCGTSKAITLALMANGTVPSQPSSIEGDAYICINSSRTYSVPAVAGATSYSWSLPSGFVGNSTTNTITVETTANASSGTLSVRANNGCGSGTQRFLNITVQKILPEKIASISGVSTGCPGLSSGFSVSSVVQGQSYQWSVSEPSFTIVENNPNSGMQLTVGNRTGIVRVVPINACGVGPETTKEVIVQVPNAPVVSNVPASLCLNAEISSYFTASSSGSMYEWSASSNVSPTATTSNTLLFKAISFGTDSIARFSVRSKSNCGYGDYAFVEIPIISVPVKPSIIAGTISPARNVATPYSVVKDPLATSYQWAASSQLVVPNLNEANITFYGSGLVTIYVSAVNACGSSVERSLEVTINQDNVAPIVSSLSPLNNATNVVIDANLVLTFSEPVVKVTGKMIQLVRFSGDVVVGNYTVDSPEVTISGNTLTINPSFDLETNTVYYVYMANGAVKDASNNFFTGMANSSFWKFTTMNPVGVEDDMITYEAQVQNPFNTSFSLNLPSGEVNLRVFDSKGTLVDEIITSEGVLNQLGNDWSSGLYILQITSKDVQEQLKIVKQ